MSVVVVVADDMRYDYERLLPSMSGAGWVHCSSAAAQTPMCSPSRASLFTGKNAWRTPVVGNATAPNMKSLESDTIATRMRAAGYRTALVGKYQNQYPYGLGSSYVPPGWTDWAAGGSRFWKPNTHETDYCFRWASDYIRSVPAAQPFFLWVAPKLPHKPFTPPARYANARPAVPPTPPSVNEKDVSDKPPFVRSKPLFGASALATFQTYRLLQARDMLAIDDGMRNLTAALQQTGRWGSTVVLFLSDNGLCFGEHRLEIKGYVYEESAHVPFIAHVPGVDSRTETSPVSLVDVPATVCAIGGTRAPGTDGVNLLPLLRGGPAVRRGAYITPPDRLTWHATRTATHTYAEHTNGFRELYDLQADPYQLTNVAGRAAYATVQNELRALLAGLRI
jgi:arylsulfatase A-like enzyme